MFESRRDRSLVGLKGFEPLTLRLSSACSNQLSYRPEKIADSPRAEIRSAFCSLDYQIRNLKLPNPRACLWRDKHLVA